MTDTMNSLAEDYLRKVLQRSQGQADTKKGKEKAEASKEELEDVPALELPLSVDANARFHAMVVAELTPEDLLYSETVYTAHTFVITDWLRQEAGMVDTPVLDDPALNQEAEIALWVNRIADKDVAVPDTIERCWEKNLEARWKVIRHYETRVEAWDIPRKERLERMRRFASLWVFPLPKITSRH